MRFLLLTLVTASLLTNCSFDVTPNEFVAAIITDKGVARAPFTKSLKLLVEG